MAHDRKRSGRNDPCPCGSGQKFERCSMAQNGARSFGAARFRRAFHGLPERLVEYAQAQLDPRVMEIAYSEWFLEHVPPSHVEFESDPERVAGYAFLPRYLFQWIPDILGPDARLFEGEWPIARRFLDEQGDRLPDDVRECIETHIDVPHEFWSVREIRPGGFVELDNVMTGEIKTVFDQRASQTTSRGTILFTAVCDFAGMSFLSGAAPLAIPPSYRRCLTRLRRSFANEDRLLTDEECNLANALLRSAYLRIAKQLLEPAPPHFVNHEGDPLRFVTMSFTLTVFPEEAFEALHDVDASRPRDELLALADRDENGRPLRIELEWHKPVRGSRALGDLVDVADITIEPGRLTIETNSDRRARNAKALVKRRLPDGVIFVDAMRRKLGLPT